MLKIHTKSQAKLTSILILVILLAVVVVAVNYTDIVNTTETEVILTHSLSLKSLPPALMDKVDNSLRNITTESKVIVKVKKDAKSRLVQHIKKVKPSSDDSLLFAELKSDEIAELVSDSDVVEVWPDLQTQSFLEESVYQINADSLWNLGMNGSGVKIAILDSGIKFDHEMLYGRVVEEMDFTGTSTDDVFGHGTHVAGIAAGNGNYTGVAYDAYIYNGKVLDDSGSGYLSWLINGIDWAISEQVDVISLSLGAIYDGSAEEHLNSPEVIKVEEAIANGITVVIASGNCGSGRCGHFNCVTTPGIARNAITVGAVDSSNNWADFSSGCVIDDFIKPDVAAPGVGICSSVPWGYECWSGTSMATPHVSGAAALLLQNDYYLEPLQLKQMLENSAIDLGEAGKDIRYGSGLIDLSKALNVSSEKPVEEEEDDYYLYIPVFTVDQENEIVFEYTNNLCGNLTKCMPRKITVVFDLEELDSGLYDEQVRTIPSGKSKTYSVRFTPKIPGKHLLKITVKEDDFVLEEINAIVSVQLGQIEPMEVVRLVMR